MSPQMRHAMAALAIAVIVGAMSEAVYVTRMSSVRNGFYRIHEDGFMVEMPDCLRPCADCEATVSVADRSVTFDGGSCRVARVLRENTPADGRYDIWVTTLGRDLYGARIGGWLLETQGCAVEARDKPTRVVIDGRNDRMLIGAPDHPDASVTGRVTCRILRIYNEVLS